MRVNLAVQPGSGSECEDVGVAGSTLVVVLDGGTVRTATGCTHGVAWYATHLADAIMRHGSEALEVALTAAIEETAGFHRDTCDLSHPGTPSAAVGIVQVTGDVLRYLVLGDVTVVIDSADGIKVISDRRISESAASERAAADAMSATDPEKPAALVRMKQVELAARNTPGGYWIAAADPVAATHALTGEIPLDEVERVAVLSDGAARAVDLLGLHDWASLLDTLRDHGPEDLIAQVRAAEATDPDAVRWPRNKLSDDATVAYCTVR